MATRIAVPKRYTMGEFSSVEARGLMLRSTNGPWAARDYAPCIYAQASKYLTQRWDWAAQSLGIAVPDPVVRATPPEDPPHVRSTEPIASSQPDSTTHDISPSGAKATTKETDCAVPSSLAQPVSDIMALVKPPPPVSLLLGPRDCQHLAGTKSIPSSPEPTPPPAPSEPR